MPAFLTPVPRRLFVLTGLACVALVACGGSDDDDSPAGKGGSSASLAVLSTSDLHYNARSYDYFKLADDPSYGFERTATLIKAARAEFPNSLLLDNGDTIQGTALADYEAQVAPIACGKQLAMYKAMAVLKYDAGTLGNHEFNYGLPFLNQVLGGGMNVEGVDAAQRCAGAGFPVALANIVSLKSGLPLVAPYQILERQLAATDKDGKPVTLPIKVGVIGFTTPGILNWDKRYLDGKVRADGAVESARKYIPELRAKGADIVVALLHGGIDGGGYQPTMENPGLYLSQVPGIDAMVMGHQHGLFPDRGAAPQYRQAGVDNVAGTVNGVPAVMPASWGKALGVIALRLKWDGHVWAVDKGATKVEARSTATGKDAAGKTTYVAPDAAVAAAVQAEHQAAIGYVKTPIGSTDFRMSTQFADVGDPGAIQIVNQAQADYVARYIRASLPQYAALPVLSVSAPFKSGFQGPADFTDVAAGPVAIYSAADLYLYPNTVYAVKVTGAQIKTWLESVSARFNRIDPAKTTPQALVGSFPGYNFDMFTDPDVQYEIDVTQPLGGRIRNLAYKGQPMSATQEFVIATNNYRATSGKSILPVLDGTATIWASPDANRDVVIDYIKAHPAITRAANGSARSWRFTKVATAGKVTITAGPGALPVAQAAGLANVALEQADDGSGRSVYSVDLSK